MGLLNFMLSPVVSGQENKLLNKEFCKKFPDDETERQH